MTHNLLATEFYIITHEFDIKKKILRKISNCANKIV